MNVHDIHAKKDAALLAGMRATGSAIRPPADLDGAAMATRAVRTVRRRRVVATATACVAAVVLAGAGIGAAGAFYADQQQPLPGTVKTTAKGAPSDEPSSTHPAADLTDGPSDEPTEYLRTGDGTLPVLPGVEHGVVEGAGAAPYILGGLWYEVPAGGWIAVGDVNAGGVAGWLAPDHPEADGLGETGTIDDMDATIELRNVFDVAGWTTPAKDSGATTIDIDGADLVVIERHEREGKIRPATITVRSGDEGWIIDTRFAATEQGDKMLRDFVGNLWLKEAGEPDWYLPEFSAPVLDAIERGIPAGWVRTEHNGLTFGVPEGWTSAETDGEFSPGVEWTGPTVMYVEPGLDEDTLNMWTDATAEEKARAAEDKDVFERVYVQGGKPGGVWWTPSGRPGSKMIDVPGADYAEVIPTAHNVGGETDYYWVDLYVHQEDRGENLFLVVEFDGGEQGLRDLHTFLGTLDFRR